MTDTQGIAVEQIRLVAAELETVAVDFDAEFQGGVGPRRGLIERADTEPLSQDGATNRFAVVRVTLQRGESSGAEPHTKGNGRSCLKYALLVWMSTRTRLQLR